MTVSNINLASIQEFAKQQETKKKDDTKYAPGINKKDWPKTLEGLCEYLCQFCGINGIPINYVGRTKLLPGDDGNHPYTSYATRDEEMIACAPIIEPGITGNHEELKFVGPFEDY